MLSAVEALLIDQRPSTALALTFSILLKYPAGSENALLVFPSIKFWGALHRGEFPIQTIAESLDDKT